MSVPSEFLRMCIDCKHSRLFQASNNRTVWYFCVNHGVMVHYNKSCEIYEHTDIEKRVTSLLDGSPIFGRFGETNN